MTDLQVRTDYDPGWVGAGVTARQAALPGPLLRLHRAILAYFLEHGGPPARPWLDGEAGGIGLDPAAAFAELAAADLVHVDGVGTVRAAYPFSGAASGHEVRLDGRPAVWAMCALDALGIPQLDGRDGTIAAADPHTGEPIRVHVSDERWRWHPGATSVLVAHASSSECAAQCACPFVNFVASPDHARAYLAGHPDLNGHLLSQQAAVGLAGEVFGSLLGTTASERR
jgi:Alkylmercury lyase